MFFVVGIESTWECRMRVSVVFFLLSGLSDDSNPNSFCARLAASLIGEFLKQTHKCIIYLYIVHYILTWTKHDYSNKLTNAYVSEYKMNVNNRVVHHHDQILFEFFQYFLAVYYGTHTYMFYPIGLIAHIPS